MKKRDMGVGCWVLGVWEMLIQVPQRPMPNAQHPTPNTQCPILLIVLVMAAALWSLPQAGIAQTPTLTADQVMEKFIAATGGRAAYNRIKSTVMKGTLEISPNGLKGTFTATSKAPNLLLVTQNIGGLGNMKQGFDGKTAWSQDPLSGLRTLEGAEQAAFAREASFNSQLHWKELYKSAQMLGVKEFDGKKAYAVKLTPAVGHPVTQYFDVKTFFMIGMDTVEESPQGTMPIHASMGDYRLVDGVKMPFMARQKVGPADLTMLTTEVKNNVSIDNGIFVKPAAPSGK
jgi:hypothetical protein